MQNVLIKVGRKADKEPLFPTTKPIVHARLSTFGILEGGMESGKTSVAWSFDLGDKMLMVETSAETFREMAVALDEAEKQIEESAN